VGTRGTTYRGGLVVWSAAQETGADRREQNAAAERSGERGERWRQRGSRPDDSADHEGRWPTCEERASPAAGFLSLRGPPQLWPTRYAEAVDPARARQLLAAERERIERDIAGLVHPDEGAAAEADEFDAGDRGRELLQDELDEGRREDLQEQLAAVERAEQRLAAGTYGLSVRSGEPIPDERLEAVPTAELTVAEAEEEARRLGR
jgi:RNA polymerase-binding transcription factor